MTGIFKEQRLIVVINKLDEVCSKSNYYDSEDEDQLTKADVIKRVQKFIQKVCDCPIEDIPKDVIIPLYGMWAYKARMLRKEPKEAKRRKAVIDILSRRIDQPSGQGEHPEVCYTQRSVTELVEELEECSGILELENRLV